MRIAVPSFAGLLAVLLLAGCSGTDGGPSATTTAPSQSASTSTPAPPSTPTTSPVAATPPAKGAPIAAVISWIEAGQPAELTGFHQAVRDGKTTQLDAGVAFTTPSGKTTCMTGMTTADNNQLACLVDLKNGPAKPPAAEGQWISGWIDYPGDTLTVGGLHGDPGQFTRGNGPELAYGQRLKFGDYQCRTDQAGLFCVNYAHQSAARISDTGVEPFGCLRQVEPSAEELVGLKFSC